MSLKDEIQALGEQIAAQVGQGSKPQDQAPPQAPEAAPADAARGHATGSPPNEIDAFLQAAHDTLDEFGDELDRYPRLTALAALGIGLAAGVIIGHRIR
ncbi:hypothetical protein N5O88_09450 [Pseudomonas sp. GD03721]|nr:MULTISPECIES: hypothetical protein [unclassified Pseudomonas]MDH1440512.1 hypothetical protein [Pseudomonas sp. GD03722]WGG03402.1 hypothetical protein N5O88_09450 [Pseudomonas sp. GD03721]WGG07570.1 hypothetical protein N5O87_09460 [Pseudomonas sp. GD03919]